MAAEPNDVLLRLAELEREVAELRASRAHLRSLVESVPDFVMRLTTDGRITYINQVAPGFQLADVLGRTAFEFTDPAYHAVVRATLDQVLATGEAVSFESIAAGPGGQPRHYFTRYSPIVEDGHITSVSCVATDVTSVKATARALAEREQRLELAVRAADIGYWHWDARADQVTWDAISCRHLGVPVDVGTTSYAGFLARVHPLDRDRIRAEVDDAMARGLYPGLRFRALAPSGEPRWLMTIGSVERAGAEITGLDGCLVDVTARTRLEQQLAQAQRMDAVGQLAAGVAHNFNNLLAAILPALELAGRRAPDTAPLLAEVRAAAERSADVVRQLMSFAGGAAPGTVDQACDAAAVARSVVQLARAMIDRRYELSLHAPSAPVPVRAEAGELEHALMNLVLNARDALTESSATAPTIRIEVEAAMGDGPVRIRVIDSGAGMSEATRDRAIEPFFTTKPAGRGTGLGLSSVYAMATARGGALRLASTLGAGTTVTLELPAAPGLPEVAAGRAPAPRGRRERVLLVDDEPAVRRAMAHVLADDGYQVRDVGDPVEAVALFAAAPDAFDVVILDESMPGMSGREVLQRLLAISPSVRVVSFSGLDQPMPGARAHLGKPVPIDRLLATLRTVLDEPG